MRLVQTLAIFSGILVGAIQPAWSQGMALLQPPPPWKPAGTQESAHRWDPSAAMPTKTMAWVPVGSFTPPPPWSVVTKLKPLDLGSIPSRGK